MVGPRTRNDLEDAAWARRLSADRAGEAAVVAIASGKGGTGKSFVATNLAVALAQWRLRVTVVDCDFGLGNAHLLLGLNPRVTLQHVLGNGVRVEDVWQPTRFGPALVPAGSGISRLAELSERELLVLVEGLARLAATQDVMVLDTAAGISPQCLMTLLIADCVVLVTNPEIAALTDAYALVKCLAGQTRPPAIAVAVNRAPLGLGRVTFDKLADVAKRFAGCELRFAGELPDDPLVTQRRLGQPPILDSHPERPVAQALSAMAQWVEGLARSARGRRELSEGMLARFYRHALARSRR